MCRKNCSSVGQISTFHPFVALIPPDSFFQIKSLILFPRWLNRSFSIDSPNYIRQLVSLSSSQHCRLFKFRHLNLLLIKDGLITWHTVPSFSTINWCLSTTPPVCYGSVEMKTEISEKQPVKCTTWVCLLCLFCCDSSASHDLHTLQRCQIRN